MRQKYSGNQEPLLFIVQSCLVLFYWINKNCIKRYEWHNAKLYQNVQKVTKYSTSSKRRKKSKLARNLFEAFWSSNVKDLPDFKIVRIIAFFRKMKHVSPVWGVHKGPYSVHRNNPWYFLTTRPGTMLKAKGVIIWTKTCFREISGRLQFSLTWRFRIPTVTTQHVPHIFLTYV